MRCILSATFGIYSEQLCDIRKKNYVPNVAYVTKIGQQPIYVTHVS